MIMLGCFGIEFVDLSFLCLCSSIFSGSDDRVRGGAGFVGLPAEQCRICRCCSLFLQFSFSLIVLLGIRNWPKLATSGCY
ncbi:GPI mannosyltransferase 2 isoform X1 [Iris pallida]|uniref:GPI mannosyltransferase 2 isoform X1 n=1 Tax=Iris pallida TaxID=29817 RepID=A0AAX6I5S2_IRIPA|nr:GPI mannosyltransferase 2 isoform X1 [Iris pallida]